MSMKLMRFFTLAAIAILAVGCSSHDIDTSCGDIRQFIFNLEYFHLDVTTRTTTAVSGTGITSTWSEGDKIGVFPDMGGDQVSFTVSSGAGTGTCTMNQTGVDSAESCRQMMCVRDARRLELAGFKIPRKPDGTPDCCVEISPALVCDDEDAVARLNPKAYSTPEPGKSVFYA